MTTASKILILFFCLTDRICVCTGQVEWKCLIYVYVNKVVA